MLNINQSNSHWTPVTVEIPVDGGRIEKNTFEAQFRRVEREEVRGIYQRLNELKNGNALADPADVDVEIIREVMIGWRKVTDDDGKEIPFTPENREALLRIAQAPFAVLQAFLRSTSGVREKN